MNDQEWQLLEDAVDELMRIYEINSAPVPIETILQKPRNQMWDNVDLAQLSGTFLKMTHRYSPRMSLARMLARHVAYSNWAQENGVFEFLTGDEGERLNTFARMLVMPLGLMQSLNSAERNPTTVSLKFEVPDDDAEVRLKELTEML